MTKDLNIIQENLTLLLKQYSGVLKTTCDVKDKFEVSGTIVTMQGKKKVDGIYFSSIIHKSKDIRFHLFPVYTHKEQLGKLPDNLIKALKGKSCFHIKYWDYELESSLKDLLKKSIELYQADGLLKK